MKRNDRASAALLAAEQAETKWRAGPAMLFIGLTSLALWWVLIRLNMTIFF